VSNAFGVAMGLVLIFFAITTAIDVWDPAPFGDSTTKWLAVSLIGLIGLLISLSSLASVGKTHTRWRR